MSLLDSARCLLYRQLTPTGASSTASTNSASSPSTNLSTPNTSAAPTKGPLPAFVSYLEGSPSNRFQRDVIESLWKERWRVRPPPEITTALLVGAPLNWPLKCRKLEHGASPSHDKVLWMHLLSELYRYPRLFGAICSGLIRPKGLADNSHAGQ